jgi:protoheme IX farnesyltransferase
VVGAALISGGSCVFNNMMERDYDKIMKRTARRSSANGTISLAKGIAFGTILTVVAMVMLLWANSLTALLALATLVLYVGVYTPLKRKSVWNTFVGSFPGALPPLGGFVAATGELGMGGWLLFAVLFLWQIPHFFALAWMYKADYEDGGFVMLPLYDKQGIATAWISLVTAMMLLPISWMFYQYNIAGIIFLIGSIVAAIAFSIAAGFFVQERSVVKARTMLIASYIYLLAVFILVFFDKA